jgi:hypothetical protein
MIRAWDRRVNPRARVIRDGLVDAPRTLARANQIVSPISNNTIDSPNVQCERKPLYSHSEDLHAEMVQRAAALLIAAALLAATSRPGGTVGSLPSTNMGRELL